jgi:hypothetical protein
MAGLAVESVVRLISSRLAQYVASCLLHTVRRELKVKSPKQDFLDTLESWKGTSCFLILESGAINLRLWVRPDSIARNGALTFRPTREGEYLEVDLSQANSFPLADVAEVRPSLMPPEVGGSFFESAICGRIENRLSITILLPRHRP